MQFQKNIGPFVLATLFLCACTVTVKDNNAKVDAPVDAKGEINKKIPDNQPKKDVPLTPITSDEWVKLEEGLAYKKISKPELVIDKVDYIVHAFKFDQEKFKPQIVSFQDSKDDYKTPKEIREEMGARIVINGGFFGDAQKPYQADGLLVIDGEKKSEINEKLSGILMIQNNLVSILEQNSWKPEMIVPELSAIQGRPRIVDRGGKNGILKPTPEQAKVDQLARTDICTTTDNHFIIFVTDPKKSGLTLFDMATIAQSESCDIALNLDGGPATAISVKDYAELPAIEIPAQTGWIHPNLIVIE